MTRLGRYTVALLFASCATLPPPQALSVANKKEAEPWMQRAANDAPQAFAHAQKLREKAERAYENGEHKKAEILADHALAAYQRVIVQSRLVNAERRIQTSKETLEKANRELAMLTSLQQQAEAEAKAYELRARVIRDAEPLAEIEKASPKREAARREAAISILEVARLLCLSSRLLDAEAGATQESTAKELSSQLDSLEQRLQSGETPTPIDEAMKLRSTCLKTLTAARRDARRNEPESDPTDVLFVQLKQAMPEQQPIRDDRGIVLTSARLFTADGRALNEPARELLSKLTAIAEANPAFPLMVVLHGAPKTLKTERATLAAEFKTLGLDNVEFHEAGTKIPSAVTHVRGSDTATQRVEFVLVAPR